MLILLFFVRAFLGRVAVLLPLLGVLFLGGMFLNWDAGDWRIVQEADDICEFFSFGDISCRFTLLLDREKKWKLKLFKIYQK